MSDRATPETDKAERMAYAGEYMVPTEVARRLERERDEAREAFKIAYNERVKVELERDEARSDLKFRRGLYKVQEQYLEMARRERDGARSIAAELAAIASHCLGSHSFALDDTAIKIAAALKRWKKSK
jgi:hypothetical protein